MGTQIPAVKAALVTALKALYAAETEVSVLYGPRGPVTKRDCVQVTSIRTVVKHPTLGRTPSRSQHESMVVTVLIDAFMPGGEDSQQLATERAYALYDPLGEYFRTSPNETLGISARTEARVVAVDLAESASITRAGQPGRNAVLTVTVTVEARI